jgi:asparagine synthase (glutamine-hydrolysing)
MDQTLKLKICEDQNAINTPRKSAAEPVGDTESGILSWSWSAWKQSYSDDSIHLFLEGFVVPDASVEQRNRVQSTRPYAADIIDLYKQKGTEFVRALRGSFAIALWDARERKLILATDHLGTRPIYYSVLNSRFGFAPSITRFAEAPEINNVVDPNSIYFYLNHSFIPAPFTIYKNVRRLEPGHLLVRANGQVTVQRYWDLQYEEDSSLTESEAADNLRSSLEDSVRFSLRDEYDRIDEVGAFLSGGTDSSTVVGLLGQMTARRIKSFSVGFEEAAYNEIHYARVAAKHFDTDAHEYFVRPEEALGAIPVLAAAYDEPFGNSSAIPTFFCLKMAREAGVKIMFAGDGGDELFGGNERYVTEQLFASYHRIPLPLRSVVDYSTKIIPGFYPWQKIRNYVRKANQPAIDRFFAYQLFFRDHADEFLAEEFLNSIDREFPLKVPRLHYARANNSAPLNRLLYVDLKLAVADNDLFKVNRMAEVHGLQVRYPFLDPSVALTAGRIPANLKVKGLSKRYIFKKAFENFLPQEILRKKKHGFGLPTGEWLRHHAGFRDLARSLLLEPRAIQRGYFKRSALERLLRLHDEERSGYYGSYIWYLMMLELWHRHHADTISR